MKQAIPKPLPSGQRFAMGTSSPGVIPLYVPNAILQSILVYSEQAANCERGGFLLGDLFVDESPYVEISQFVPAVRTEGQFASLTFTHETWAALHRTIEQQYPGESIVGWQHTHPGMGVFLSAHDKFIHRHFFHAPWQVALVVDPRRHELGFFQWQGDTIIDSGFTCILPV